ncbi:muconolactone Delta-isomerase family protein [Actinomycetospora flava]|uniref:Muconolactone Delta-isomerase family protein n=1 Tax=Actinomycetospora flava TaxID=3129232 RepID=A0ABU8M508_9PSEU
MNYLVKATPTERMRTLGADERETLLAGEREAATALITAGSLAWMWYLPDSRTSVSIWNADDRDALDADLRTLPFLPYHDLEISVLAAHPAFPTPLGVAEPASPES